MKKGIKCCLAFSMCFGCLNNTNIFAKNQISINEYVENGDTSVYITKNGEVITTTKYIVETKSGMKITNTTTICGDRMIKGYYSDDGSIAIQEYYRNNELVRTFDMNGKVSEYQIDRVTEETEVGWGYSYEKNSTKRSYACPSYFVSVGYYERRNIEIYKNEAESEQYDFSDAVYMVIQGEKGLKSAVGNITFNKIIDTVGDLINASYGDVLDAIMAVTDLLENLNEGINAVESGEQIAEYSANLFNLYETMVTYDHLR